MPYDQRLRSEMESLQKHWELISAKLMQFEREKILETKSEERFRLENKIAETKAERQQIEEQLRELERQQGEAARMQKIAESAPEFRSLIPKVFHNLPQPDYGRFVGREAELAKVEKILQPYPHSQHSLVTIDGIGGIGKSALALEIAHRYLRNFDNLAPEKRFEAMIWTSAKQTLLTAEGISTRRQILRTLDDIYNALAVGLQREDITRARKEDQTEVVRNALTRQRTLLIVDNLETVDDEAVMEFLRELPAPTKAIVTTRHRLDVAYPVRLTGMPWDDAHLLIQQECEKKGVTFSDQPQRHGDTEQKANQIKLGDSAALWLDDVRRLFERTGGVPLAMVWSIAQMGMGYGVEQVLTRLGQPTSDISRFCFDGAIARMSGKPAHKLLMVLSLCAESASRESLGYATELAEFDRDDGLVELEKLSLVNKQGDRFSLLPLTKQYAAAELEKSQEKEQLREKWIEYFKKLSEEYSGEYWKWANYDWLLAEGENILSIIDLTIETGLEEIALSFARPAKHYLEIKNLGNIFAEYGEKLYKIALISNDKRTCAWICIYWFAWFYSVQGKKELAEDICKRGLSLYQELDDVKGMCFARIRLGNILREADRTDEAIKIYQQTMDLAQTIAYGDGIASVHFCLSIFATKQRKWEEAKIHGEAFINWYEEHQETTDQDISALMAMIGNLGWIEFHLGNVQHSKELMERSLAFFESMGRNIPLYRQLSIVEKTLNNRDKALQYAQEVYFLAERWGMASELEKAQALLKELNASSQELLNTQGE